jgi:hypothetical protein
MIDLKLEDTGDRSTVLSCLVPTLRQLLAHFLDGTTHLGVELNHLFKALRNPNDGTVKDLAAMAGAGPAETMAARFMLGQFLKQLDKEKQDHAERIREAKAETEQAKPAPEWAIQSAPEDGNPPPDGPTGTA